MKRFVTPTPNCGHGGRTFTWITLAELWMCGFCVASIGKLYRVCTQCGHFPPNNTQLVDVHGEGALCVRCRRHVLGQLRLNILDF